jgi:hypothetical protein
MELAWRRLTISDIRGLKPKGPIDSAAHKFLKQMVL